MLSYTEIAIFSFVFLLVALYLYIRAVAQLYGPDFKEDEEKFQKKRIKNLEDRLEEMERLIKNK